MPDDVIELRNVDDAVTRDTANQQRPLQEYCEYVIRNSIKRFNIDVSDAKTIAKGSYVKNSVETLMPKSSSIIVVNINS